MQGVFFFLGGDVNWGQISEEEKAKLQRSWERMPNLFAHLQHLPEPTMNSIYAASDVVVAAYRSFPNSSNALTKVAVFECPIVVSDGYLMAERVRRFELGEVIPEGNAEALVAALRRMLAPGYPEELRGRARWKDYREAHSVEQLNKVFSELVAAI
jgi:glycosyltransferase involved in cell wall biosynthesis